jgi:hypothetical protein
VQELNGTLYGVYFDGTVHSLGTTSALDAGPELANVFAPPDRGGGAFLSQFLTGGGQQLLAGYTTNGAGFPGNVALVDLRDGGVSYVNAPGNFSAVAFAGGFAINGGGVGDAGSEDGVYLLNAAGGASALASFDSAWMANSGYTAVTSQQVLLLGYFNGVDFMNHVSAAPPTQWNPSVASGMPFMLNASVEIAAADDLSTVGTVGTDAVLVHGGFQASAPYAAFTTEVDRLPLALSSSTVTPGTAKAILLSADQCTYVGFTATSGANLLLGIADKNGSRLVTVSP